MKAERSSHSLVDLLCPSKVHEPFTLPADRKHVYRCSATWAEFIWKILFKQSRWGARLLSPARVVMAMAISLRRTPSRHTQIGTLTWLCAIRVMSSGGKGGCGGWGRLVLLVKVSGGSAAPGRDGRCLVWDGCWLMSLVSPSVIFFFFLQYIT